MTDLSRFNAALNIIHQPRQSTASSADKQLSDTNTNTNENTNADKNTNTNAALNFIHQQTGGAQCDSAASSANNQTQKPCYTEIQAQIKTEIPLQMQM